MSSKAHARSDLIQQFHDGMIDVADGALARAMHIAPGDEKRIGALPALLRRYGNHNFGFEGATFHDIRAIFRAIDPQPGEVFCDAGAGYGHVVFYGAQVSPCRLRAIEILPARCEAMRRTARQLAPGRVEIVQGDALPQSYDDVSYLLLNSPFFAEIATPFVARLAASATPRLTVIAMNTIVSAFRNNEAFREIDVAVDIPNYRFGLFKPVGS